MSVKKNNKEVLVEQLLQLINGLPPERDLRTRLLKLRTAEILKFTKLINSTMDKSVESEMKDEVSSHGLIDSQLYQKPRRTISKDSVEGVMIEGTDIVLSDSTHKILREVKPTDD